MPVVPTITADDFRALARSSPWLWHSLEIVWDARHRVWLERPDHEVVQWEGGLSAQESQRGQGCGGVVVGDDGRVEQACADDSFFACELEPERRPDGLVVERPN